MIEQQGRVVEIEEGLVWVSYVRQTACQSCKSEAVCGNSYLEKWASGRITHIPALTSLDLRIGDDVIIGIAENAVLKASVFVYALPILLMVFGCYVGNLFSGNDLGAGIGGGVGMTSGFFAVYVHGLFNRHSSQYSPVVLKDLGAHRLAIQSLN